MFTGITNDLAHYASFQQKLQNILYNAALGIKAAIRRTFREKLVKELDLKSPETAVCRYLTK